jgi:peptide deformylase
MLLRQRPAGKRYFVKVAKPCLKKNSRGERHMALRHLRKYKYEDLIYAKGHTPRGNVHFKPKSAPARARQSILRARSIELARVDDGVRALLDDMVDTMREMRGSGLAAIQVGVPRRLIVVEYGGTLLKLINPVITEAHGENHGIEGCLSIPGVYGIVKRPEKIVVKALDERGKRIKVEGAFGLARVLCHEIDHLDGILFIDKAVPGTIYKRS